MTQILRIATRKSPLALWQAHFVAAQLTHYHPDLTVELVPMVTQGDVILDTPLAKIGGKGLFVKQLETALLNHEADIAVHSIKDIPMAFPKGLGLMTYCEREDPRDAFVSNHFDHLNALPAGSVVGTSSLRRQCQLRALRPDLVIKDLRGNVGTRLQKLDDGEYDAIILAAAGLIRLKLTHRIRAYLSIDVSLPAVGQGAVGIETRTNDDAILALLAPLDHAPTRLCVLAERAMNQRLEGGCQVPIACHAQRFGHVLRLRGLVGAIDGSEIIYQECQGGIDNPELIGRQLADALLEKGADRLLQRVYSEASR